MSDTSSNPGADDVPVSPLSWMARSHRSEPAEALARIRVMCEMMPELYSAICVVLATHQSVPKGILAAAIKQFRRDADSLSQEDVVGLMVSILTSSRQAFDAVLRSRKKGERKAISTPWVKE